MLRMRSSWMCFREGLARTDVSEESFFFIFRLEGCDKYEISAKQVAENSQ
jgi:hypothetical protein